MSSKTTNSKPVNEGAITWHQAFSIAKRDAKLLCPQSIDQYAKRNQFHYHTLINVWLYVIDDMLPEKPADRLSNAIKMALSKGTCFINLIQEASATSDALISGNELPGNVFSLAVRDTMLQRFQAGTNQQDILRDVLLVLRFPKRFSPLDAQAVNEDGLRSFIACEQRNSRKNVRNEYSNTITNRAIEIVDEMFYDVDKKLGSNRNGLDTIVKQDWGFSSGSCHIRRKKLPIGTCKDPAIKVKSSKCPALKWLMCVGDTDIIPWEYTCLVPSHRHFGEYQTLIQAVPKSYKSPRIIGMEEPLLGAHAYGVRRYMENCVENSVHSFAIHPDDQSINRHMAAIGSLHGELATLDLSSASDSIPVSLVARLFQHCPHTWEKLLEHRAGHYVLPEGYSCDYYWRDKHITNSMWETTYGYAKKVNDEWQSSKRTEFRGNFKFECRAGLAREVIGRKSKCFNVIDSSAGIPLQMMFTSGSQLTPITQCIVFYAITRAACEYAAIFLHKRIRKWEKYITVYNDDIICPTWAAETVIDALVNFGFIVNTDKSFYDQALDVTFRESCGGDYYGGIDISSRYWPRKPISQETPDVANTAVILVELQHRLYYTCPKASRFLYYTVMSIMPKMTESDPSQQLEDLWSDYAVPQITSGPTLDRSTSLASREIHLQPSTTWRVYDPLYLAEAEPYRMQIDLIRYMTFLKEGPFYEDKLLELLGVSSPRASQKELCSTPSVTWKRRLV